MSRQILFKPASAGFSFGFSREDDFTLPTHPQPVKVASSLKNRHIDRIFCLPSPCLYVSCLLSPVPLSPGSLSPGSCPLFPDSCPLNPEP
jgi:hypothetical protein